MVVKRGSTVYQLGFYCTCMHAVHAHLCSGGASMKLQPEEQEAVGWDDDDELVIDEGR